MEKHRSKKYCETYWRQYEYVFKHGLADELQSFSMVKYIQKYTVVQME